MPTVTATCRFISSHRHLRIVLLPQIHSPHPVTGQKVEVQRGFTVDFARFPFEDSPDTTDGSFEWEEGKLWVDPTSGIEVDVVEALRAKPDYGTRFVEMGREPGRLLPDEGELLGEIIACTARGDQERIAEIHERESETHGRENVLEAAVGALQALEEG